MEVLLTATLFGGDNDGNCSSTLRLQLLDLEENVVSDNGTFDSNQVQLSLFTAGSNYGPGQYLIRVLCALQPVGEDLPFEIVAAAAPAETIDATPLLTG